MSRSDEAAADKSKRAVLRMSEKDFARLRVLMAQQGLTWQQMLTEALNAWLKRQGKKDLEDRH